MGMFDVQIASRKLEALDFDDAFDRRRYFEAGDNHIAGVGDSFERNSPARPEID